jgi:hypothetical protein
VYSVLLRYTDFDYPFGISKPFLHVKGIQKKPTKKRYNFKYKNQGPTRGIAITMIDNMEYKHTMYIITTRKY